MKAERRMNDFISSGINWNGETDFDPIDIIVYHNYQFIQGFALAIELDSLELCNCPKSRVETFRTIRSMEEDQ